MNTDAQKATTFHKILKLLEKQLTNITESDYYQELAASGFYVVEANLVDVLQATRETIEINEQIIEAMRIYPDEDLGGAIAKFLELKNDGDAFDIDPYL